jgi:hypothetical protein
MPFLKCVELALSGIRFRLFRASVTVVIVALASAFLMTLVSEALVAREVAGAVQAQTGPRRSYLFWSSRLSVPLAERELVDELAAVVPGDERWQEFRAWGRLDDSAVEQLADLSGRQLSYRAFFDDLSEGKKRPLVGRARGTAIFAGLQSEASRAHFAEEVRKLGRKFPTSLEAFLAFLDQWQDLGPTRRAILDGHRAAVNAARDEIGGDTKRFLAESDDTLAERLAVWGFRMKVDEVSMLRQQAALELDAERLVAQLANPAVMQRLANRLDLSRVSDMTPARYLEEVSTPGGAAWLVELLRSREDGLGLPEERVLAAAQSRVAQRRVAGIEASLAPVAAGSHYLGFSGRVLCLIAVSLLVCVVGITNAMLMSVMERFREIATMKCLGATDGVVMSNFILESCCQGIAGGVLGALAGGVLGVLRCVSFYGWISVRHIPFAAVLTAGACALVLGVIVSALAAVYPARVAARLAPMEAMRVE